MPDGCAFQSGIPAPFAVSLIGAAISILEKCFGVCGKLSMAQCQDSAQDEHTKMEEPHGDQLSSRRLSHEPQASTGNSDQ